MVNLNNYIALFIYNLYSNLQDTDHKLLITSPCSCTKYTEKVNTYHVLNIFALRGGKFLQFSVIPLIRMHYGNLKLMARQLQVMILLYKENTVVYSNVLHHHQLILFKRTQNRSPERALISQLRGLGRVYLRKGNKSQSINQTAKGLNLPKQQIPAMHLTREQAPRIQLPKVKLPLFQNFNIRRFWKTIFLSSVSPKGTRVFTIFFTSLCSFIS